MSVKVLDQGTAQMKAATTATGTRTLDFYAAAFSQVPDKNGDIIDPHALDEWLEEFYKVGKPLPISFAHAAVRDDIDPFAIIGYASADPDHVWIDNYGLRVKAILDTAGNDNARQVASLVENGVLAGASVAFMAKREDERKDGAFLITKMSILAAGPCLSPANDEAVVLGIKSARALIEDVAANLNAAAENERKATEREEKIAEIGRSMVDMISERVGLKKDEPDEEEPAPETTDADAEITPETTDAEAEKLDEKAESHVDLTTDERQAVIDALATSLEVKHGAAPNHIQSAHNALVRAGAKCAANENVAAKSFDPDDIANRVRSLRLIRASFTR